MRLENMQEVFTYLNCENVSYKFYTKNCYMEITIQLRDRSLQFLIEQRATSGLRSAFDLRVVEPSGNTLIQSDILFKVSGDLSLIELIARYIERLAYFLYKDGKQLVMRETFVQGQKYETIYYDSFLGHLHAAGFISTDYVEHKTTLDESTTLVFVKFSDLK